MSDASNPYRAPQPVVAAATNTAAWPIVAEGSTSRADALHALQLTRRNVRTFVIFLLYAGLLGLVLYAAQGKQIELWINLLVALPLMLLIFVLLPRAQVGTLFRRGAPLFAPHRCEISPSGIVVTTATARSEQSWQAFSRYLKSDRVVVLYHGGGFLLSIFARVQFAEDDDWQRFVALVEQNVPRK